MAEQNPVEQGSTDQPSGRHAAPDDVAGTTTGATSDTTTDAPADAPTERAADAGPADTPTRRTADAGPADTPTQHVETPTQQVASPGAEQPTRVSPVPQAEPTRQTERPQGPPPASPAPRTGGGDGARRAVRRVTGVLATLLRLAGLVLALVLVAYIVLTLVGVNPENGVAQLVAEGADVLVMRFRDLFLPADPRLELVVNYGLAALFWLVVGLAVARAVRLLGRLV